MTARSQRSTAVQRIAGALYRRPWLKLVLLLMLPVVWLVSVYGGALASLLAQSFYRLDSFAGTINRNPTLETWREL